MRMTNDLKGCRREEAKEEKTGEGNKKKKSLPLPRTGGPILEQDEE